MRRTFAFAAMLLTCSAGHGASFDCKLAKTPQEHAICGSPELSKLDDQLGAAYKRILASASTETAAFLRADEARWLRSTASACHAEAAPIPKLAACLARRYKTRLGLLENSYKTVAGVLFVSRTEEFSAPIPRADRLPQHDEDSTTLHASWPQADTKDPSWQAWNTALEEQVRKLSRPEGDPHKSWNASWAKEVDADVRAEIEFLDDRLITTHIENDFMGYGAAHPGEVWTNFHWLRQERRPLKVEDVFRPGTAWANTVAQRCEAGIRQQSKENNGTVGYGGKEEADALVKVIASPENWILDETGLTISFPEYTVSPRYATPTPVTTPWSALQPFLAANFVRPRGKATLIGGQSGGY